MSAKDRTSRPSPPGAQRLHPDSAPTAQPPLISARWLGLAVGAAVAAAAICGWAALCLLFWQGSWQLLYHPSAAVPRTPSSVGLSFQSVLFGPNSAGQPQLQGWWIPHPAAARYTVLYLHGADGNVGNTVDALQPFADAGLNVFAFDYRGYGTSAAAHPSESGWRQDAEAAIVYLTATRHIPAASLLLAGKDLGANLALEMAAAHPELAGVVLDQPLADPMRSVFSDPRAKLVPARVLVLDRFDLGGPASELRIPVLWMARAPATAQQPPAAYQTVTARKTIVWLPLASNATGNSGAALTRWLDDLAPPR